MHDVVKKCMKRCSSWLNTLTRTPGYKMLPLIERSWTRIQRILLNNLQMFYQMLWTNGPSKLRKKGKQKTYLKHMAPSSCHKGWFNCLKLPQNTSKLHLAECHTDPSMPWCRLDIANEKERRERCCSDYRYFC